MSATRDDRSVVYWYIKIQLLLNDKWSQVGHQACPAYERKHAALKRTRNKPGRRGKKKPEIHSTENSSLCH